MKQLGLALHGYHAAHDCFPPAGVAYGLCVQDLSHSPPYVGNTTVLNASGLMMLLPYLDQVPLYDTYDQKHCACTYTSLAGVYGGFGTVAGGVDAVTSGNAQVVSTRLAVFNCPSDNGDPYLSDSIQPGSGFNGPKTNYDFSASTNEYYCNYWFTAPPTSRRMFGQNSNCRMADVQDGTSNTIAMAERTFNVYNGPCSAWGFRSVVMVGVDLEFGINEWAVDIHTGELIPGTLGAWNDAGSLHPGGMNVLLADGSVPWLNETTDTVILVKLAAMADGEVFKAPW